MRHGKVGETVVSYRVVFVDCPDQFLFAFLQIVYRDWRAVWRVDIVPGSLPTRDDEMANSVAFSDIAQ